MTELQDTLKTEPCFQLKGGRISVTTLELFDYAYISFNRQLAQTVKTAPQFFNQMPVVISLEKMRHDGFIDFIELTQLCQEYGLAPVAVRGGSEEQQVAATVAGLAKLPAQGNRSQRSHDDTVAAVAQAAAEAAEEKANEAASRPSKLITSPIRSGQQVYAQGGDLIVLSAVSAGAEVLADGHIHIYGPLRGRALAGIQGDTEARIFCQSLEAELISIAGHYKVNEDLRGPLWKTSVKVSLEDAQLIIDTL